MPPNSSAHPRHAHEHPLSVPAITVIVTIALGPTRRLRSRRRRAAGDVEAVRRCLRVGLDDVDDIMTLTNQNKQHVVGVTPLYLAAQQGHLVRGDGCRLLPSRLCDGKPQPRA